MAILASDQRALSANFDPLSYPQFIKGWHVTAVSQTISARLGRRSELMARGFPDQAPTDTSVAIEQESLSTLRERQTFESSAVNRICFFAASWIVHVARDESAMCALNNRLQFNCHEILPRLREHPAANFPGNCAHGLVQVSKRLGFVTFCVSRLSNFSLSFAWRAFSHYAKTFGITSFFILFYQMPCRSFKPS